MKTPEEHRRMAACFLRLAEVVSDPVKKGKLLRAVEMRAGLAKLSEKISQRHILASRLPDTNNPLQKYLDRYVHQMELKMAPEWQPEAREINRLLVEDGPVGPTNGFFRDGQPISW